ncbi:hypothetical protein [Pseudalkalibacillus berkeleyi]|uniref:Uncharacterized protein n=1 Tax=Pseudalkalibacillus berkeleyi TaxID=1069813 RepID=A0ABS9H4S6_9BACL|nr:hypothetical protein [Pseudalkalibacillus berkeleyi]MCF6138815.1 hypothetical protein [Pseudalkalibacillus berkeleyi]
MKKRTAIILSILSIFVIVSLFLYGVYLNPNNETANFKLYKEDREEVVRMLNEGEIKKEGEGGFAFYHTPPQFSKANVDDILHARMYSEERHFVFFQWVDSPVFGPGLIEGFLYTSTGEPPTNREFSYLDSCHFEKIEGEENWYFASNNTGYYD